MVFIITSWHCVVHWHRVFKRLLSRITARWMRAWMQTTPYQFDVAFECLLIGCLSPFSCWAIERQCIDHKRQQCSGAENMEPVYYIQYLSWLVVQAKAKFASCNNPRLLVTRLSFGLIINCSSSPCEWCDLRKQANSIVTVEWSDQLCDELMSVCLETKCPPGTIPGFQVRG